MMKWLVFPHGNTKRHLFKSIPPGPTTNPCCHVGPGRVPGTAQSTSQHWVKGSSGARASSSDLLGRPRSEQSSSLSRCLQDAELLLKLTEEVNATFRINVGIFPGFLFSFLPSRPYSLSSIPSLCCLLGFCECRVGAMFVTNGQGNSPSVNGSRRRLSQPGSSQSHHREVRTAAAVGTWELELLFPCFT